MNLVNKILSEANPDSEYIKALGDLTQPIKSIFSLKSFKYFDDNKIQECINYFGHDGSNTEEDAFDDLKEKINFYKKMSDPVILYRLVRVKNKKIIDTNEMGEHYTPKENELYDLAWNIGIMGGKRPYVLKVFVPLSEIDIVQTIIHNLNFPLESEITLKNKGKGAKIIEVYKLSDTGKIPKFM